MKKKFYKAKNDAMFKAIFCNPKNKDLLERLLFDATGKKMEVLSIKSPELLKRNVYIKGKTLDLLVKTDEGEVNIEINTSFYATLHRRNLAYICNRYSNGLKPGEDYSKMLKYMQLNLTSTDNKEVPPFEKYLLKGELTNKNYVDNLVIYEFNLPKLKDECYNNYRFLLLLDAEEDDLKRLSKGDELMEKLEREITRLNDDNDFIRLMSEEEEIESLRKTHLSEAYNNGKDEGILEEKHKIAKEMLNDNVPIETVAKYTNLSIEKINNL